MSDSREAFEMIRKMAWAGVGAPDHAAADNALVEIHEYAKELAARAQDGGVVPEPFGTESAYQAAKKSILTGSNMVISCDLVRELVEALRKSDSQKPSAVVPVCRVEFETWAAFDCMTYEFEQAPGGWYLDANVQSMWIGYEAGSQRHYANETQIPSAVVPVATESWRNAARSALEFAEAGLSAYGPGAADAHIRGLAGLILLQPQSAVAPEGWRVEAAQSIRAAFDEGFTEGAEYYRSPEAEQGAWADSLAKEAFDALKSPPKQKQES